MKFWFRNSKSTWSYREKHLWTNIQFFYRHLPNKKVLISNEIRTQVGVAGFEPTTPCSQSRCANRTALHPEWSFFQNRCKGNGLFCNLQIFGNLFFQKQTHLFFKASNFWWTLSAFPLLLLAKQSAIFLITASPSLLIKEGRERLSKVNPNQRTINPKQFL